MLKKYIPFTICIALFVILIIIPVSSAKFRHINTYPNLPAPIGAQKILITSAGQAAEGTILSTIADNLHLDADYRPRALGTDLYDYHCVVIALGFSVNGLAYTNRSFQEELIRIEQLAEEAEASNIPLIVIQLSNSFRGDGKTFTLFEKLVSYTDYFIGMKNMQNINQYAQMLHTYGVPITFVHQISDITIPFNSIFR